MGGCLGSLATCCVCNTASCCVQGLCSCCSAATSKVAKSVMTRVLYSVQLIFMAFIAWILANLPYWTENNWFFSHIPGLKDCPASICYGTMAVYRIAFALTLFHLLLALMLIGVKSSRDCRANIQDGFWFFKFLFLLLISFVSFLIPNDFFIGYGWIALIGAALFILVQLILIVDFAHTWNETWVGYYEQSNESRGWAAAIIGSTFLMYLIALIGTILMYVYLAPSNCQQNTTFITLNLILCFLFSIFSINNKIKEKNPRSGLLQSAVVTLYCTYLVWSSIMSEPDSWECKGPLNGNGTNTAPALVGVIITFLAVMYSAFSVSGSAHEMLFHDEETGKTQDSAMKKQEGSTSSSEEETSTEQTKLINSTKEDEEIRDDESEHTSYNYTYFHITYALAAMYLCMLLTNWKTVSHDQDDKLVVDYGPAAVWVKIISSWLVSVIYFWSLIAPCIFPDRFNYQ